MTGRTAPAVMRSRTAAEADLLASLPADWISERLGISDEAASVLIRSQRVRPRVARTLARRGRLEPLSSLPDVLVEAVRGHGQSYDHLCLEIGLAQALSTRDLVEREPMQDLLARFGRPAVAFAVNWLGRPLASGDCIALDDAPAIMAAGHALIRTWLAGNASILGGWPVPGSPIESHFGAVFMPVLDRAMRAALRDVLASAERGGS